MVLEPAVLDRVDGYLQLRRCYRQPLEHGAETKPFQTRPRRQVEAIEGRECDAGWPGGGEQILKQLSSVACQRGHRGGILVVEGGAQRRGMAASNAIGLG